MEFGMEFSVRQVGRNPVSDEGRVVLSGQRLVSEDFSGRRLKQFSAAGVRLERCRFDSAVIEYGCFGSGRVVSEYVGCTFDGAKIRMGPGGYARFVDCTFEGAVIENWFCFAVDLVRCTFSGRLRKAVFNGTAPSDDRDVPGRSARNEIEGNDFSRAKLIDVAFRTGVDLTKQRLPSGPEYTYLEDAASVLRRARSAFTSWDDPRMKKEAGSLLKVLEDTVAAGQSQLLVRVNDFPRVARPAIQALLDAGLAA
jgi:hypothetical protein